jgi:hypothetical protein
MSKFLIEIDGYKTILFDNKMDALTKIKELFEDFYINLKEGPCEGYNINFPEVCFMNLSEIDCKRFLIPKTECSNVLSFPSLKLERVKTNGTKKPKN